MSSCQHKLKVPVARAQGWQNKGTSVGGQDDFFHGAAAQFPPLPAKSSLAMAGVNVPRSSVSNLGQQEVALPRLNVFFKSSQILDILSLNVHYIIYLY